MRVLICLGVAAFAACASPVTEPGVGSLANSNGDPKKTHPDGVLFATAPLGGEPYGLAIDSAGDLLVAQVLADSVTRFALPGTAPVAAIFFGTGISQDSGTFFIPTGPVHVAINHAGARAYVVEQFGDAMGVVDLATNTITHTIPLSNDGFNVAVAPNDGRVYASTADGRLYVVDAATNAIVDSMRVGTAANGFAFSPDGGVLYASSRDAGTVTAFRTSDDARLAVYVTGGRPQRLAVSPNGTRLYAANEDSGLSVINVTDGTVLPSVNPMGSGYGLGITPDGAQLYLTEPLSGRVAIIDRPSLQTNQILIVGGAPRNVAFDFLGTTGVVTDGNGRVLFFH
jgi:DNA-binding beta-propeller fold protein YncE